MERITNKKTMKLLRNIFLAGIAALALVSVRADETDAAKTDKAQLQGEWTMVSGERDGQKFPAEFLQNSKRVASNDVTTVTIQGQLFMKATFTLDPATSPKKIDYAVTGGPYAGNRQLGIYQLDGDTVKYCFTVPGKERPAEFSTKPDDGRTLTVWKKEKKP
jgi:uncharacterized protein (TIGR03067 family)